MNRQTFRLGDGIEIELLPKGKRENHAKTKSNNENNEDDEPQVILDVENVMLGFVGLELTNFTGRLQMRKVEKKQQQEAESSPSSQVVVKQNSSSYPPQKGVTNENHNAALFTPHEAATAATATANVSPLPPPATPINTTTTRSVTLKEDSRAAATPVDLSRLTLGSGRDEISNKVQGLPPHKNSENVKSAEEPQQQQIQQEEAPIRTSPSSLVSATPSNPLHFFQTVASPVRGKGKISIHDVFQQKLAAGGIMLGKMASDNGGGGNSSPRRQRNALNSGSIMRLTSTSSSSSSAELFAPPTKLHQACADGLITFSELVHAFLAEPQAVRIKDAHGRLPIHVLGDNDQLLGTAHGRQVATSFAHKLMYEYPASVGTLNEDGFIPFMNIIQDWLVWIYETHDKFRKNNKARRLQQVGLEQVGGAILLSLGGRSGSKSDDDVDTPEQESLATPLHNTRSALASTSNTVEKSLLMEKSARAFPLRVDLWEEVEWCFQMLSCIMDEFGGACKILPPPDPRKHLIESKKGKIDKRQELVKHVIAAFPTLLRTVLLLDNSATRKRILRMSLFRRMLLCPESVGDWIMRLLRRGGVPSHRAVDYFELVSETKVSDLTGGFIATTAQDLQAFQAAKLQVFCAIEDIKGVVSSLVILENRGRERAAATAAVGHVLNSKLSRPFILSLSCIDLVLHIALLLAFRHVAGQSIGPDGTDYAFDPTRHVLLVTSHYVMRIVCEVYALFTVSPRVLHMYVMDVWKLFDLIAIVLTIVATMEQKRNGGQYLNGLNALVVGLLWFKILGFLKIINKEMSTFIHALMQILFDIRYFMIVMLVVIFMFGDMFHFAVSTVDQGDFCLQEGLSDPTEDFCVPTTASPSYLRVYSMLIGDYELSDMRDTPGITILFVIFTVIGVVILLNVLIAVVSDSYEKATTSSSLLFGGGRVIFVAQNEALESLLKPDMTPLTYSSRLKNVCTALWRLFRWLVLLAILATAFDCEFYIIIALIRVIKHRLQISLAILLIIMATFMAAALFVVTTFALGGLCESTLTGSLARAYEALSRFNMALIRMVAGTLFGLKNTSHDASVNEDETIDEEWSGRLNYLEKRIEGIVENASNDIVDKIEALEERLNEPDDRETRAMASDAAARTQADF